MALQPARVKFRKMHRGSRAGLATRGHTVAFGEYGLMALERCWMDSKPYDDALYLKQLKQKNAPLLAFLPTL